MKITSFIVLALICLIFVTCKNADETCVVVPTTAPITSINLKFISKTTGADLIFSPGAPYKFSDLQVASLGTQNNPYVFVDSAQKNNPVIALVVDQRPVPQSFSLKLGAMPADTISATFTTVQQSRCNSYIQLSGITLDGKTFCSPCSPANQPVTIKK